MRFPDGTLLLPIDNTPKVQSLVLNQIVDGNLWPDRHNH